MTDNACWWVYIIDADDSSLYTGISTDVERRFQQHATGKGAKYFNARQPHRIVWREKQSTRSAASQREAAIKKMSRQAKLQLIASKHSAQ